MSGLYIHIPYCHSKCAYCDFYSTPNHRGMERLLDALAREWGMRSGELPDTPSTLYLGGGTPSIVPPRMLSELIGRIGLGQWVEATIECNPEDVTPQWIEAVRALGFNRVSMGVQSLDDRELQLIGRRHSAQQAVDCAALLMQSGMKVSLDVIYGLPGQSLQSWRDTLDGVLRLHPHHLSAYLLSYEPRTRLWAMLHAGKVHEASEELIDDMYRSLCSRASQEGYDHYEVSNFALPRCRAVHNSSYWDGTPYLGLGPSAHSFDGRIRRFNPSSVTTYINAITSSVPPFEVDEEDALNRLNDMIITRLRTADGLSVGDLTSKWGESVIAEILQQARPLIAAGLLARNGDRLYIPECEWLRSDSVMRTLIRV